jgi:tRNA (uracil-5-)-methyltransferase TRM9
VRNEVDDITENFDITRRRSWKECIEFMEGRGGTAIDIACGNGRHTIPMSGRAIAVGMDSSAEMVKIASRNAGKKASFVVGDASAIPFKSSTFDFALFIAALHNIRGQGGRVKALEEMGRVLKDGGGGLVSVWSRWQDRWRTHFLRNALTLRIKNFGDIVIPWKMDVEAMRFYHLYSMRELKKDAKKAGLEIVKSWSVKKTSKKHADNHFIIVRKRI